MKTKRISKEENNKIEQSYINDYNHITKNISPAFNKNCEWTKPGDNFQKLSLYDSKYKQLKSTSNTTPINKNNA